MQSICKEGHAVIQTKTDLQRFLSLEKTAYLYGDRRDTFIAYLDRKSTRLNSSHVSESRMPSSA